jgi:diguanylate cyclase (GGDEF)-like protein/PAS domain S-box-containing protein
MAKAPAQKVTEQAYDGTEDEAIDLGLFAVGGSFERFPGAVLVAGHNGLVLAANEAAAPIAALLQRGTHEDLRAAIGSALSGQAAQINPLLLAPGNAKRTVGLAYDVAVLPWGSGTAALLLGRDITLERSLRAALIESRQRYKDLVEASSDFAWETDASGRFVFVSAQGALGYSAAEMVGAQSLDLLVDAVEAEESPFSTRVPVQEAEMWVKRLDGEPACLLATALPLSGPDGEWCGARGLCRNITAERTHEAALAGDRNRERLLAYILGIVRDEMDPAHMLHAAAGALVPALPATGASIYSLDETGGMVCVAQAGTLPPDEVLAPALRRVAGGEEQVELAVESGALFAKETCFQDQRNGVLCLWRGGAIGPWHSEDRFLLTEIAGQIGLANRQLARQQALEEASSTDPLTGLLNRRCFIEAFQERYARSAGRRINSALFFIDLDNFKLVNDTHGHQRGDMALTALARILREQIRSRDLAARLGGDEFALYVEDISHAAAEQKGRELILAAAGLKEYSGDPERPLGLSIGIAVCDPRRQETPDELIERADKAMYDVKRHGKGGVSMAPPPRRANKRRR